MKNMRNMKAFAILALIFIMAFSAAACGGGNNAANEPADEPANVANELADEPVDEPADEPEAVVEKIDLNGDPIKFAMWWDGMPKPDTELGEIAVQMHADAEKKYNTKIEYINIPWGEMVEKVTSTALSGDPFADVVILEFRWIPAMLAGGYLKPLDDFMDVSKEERFPETVKKIGTFNGKQYGFNASANESGGLYYNKTMFKREGLTDPYELQQKGEWTWSAYLDAAKKLTKDTNGDGTPDQYGLSADPTILATYLIHSNGGQIVDEEAGTVTFDTPEAIEAYDFMAALYNEHKVIKPNEGDNWGDPRKYFTQGLVGMTQGWVWEGADRIANMTDEWGYVFFPKGPKAADYVVPLTNSNMMFIPAGAKHPKESIELWKDLQNWDQMEEGFTEWLEASLPDENSIDTALTMPSKMIMSNWEGYGIADVFYGLNDRIAKGEESPATAVAKEKQKAQGLMDAVTKKK